MPAFYYSATFDESLGMLRELCRLGYRVIPDRTYDEPGAQEFAQVTEELIALVREGPGFYLSGSFTKKPVRLARIEGGSAQGKYAIDPLTLGPIIEGLLGRLNEVDGVPTLLLGFVSHQDR